MFINVTDSKTASNKGSSTDLVHCLEKENRLDKESTPENWFNTAKNNIPAYEVKASLDNNVAKLGRIDAKFFLLNISPSQKEIKHLKELYGEEGAKTQLKEYAQTVMDEYARNFKRPGIESGKDLLWFGKLENHRYYNHHDPEVKHGIRKRGERKKGEQMHVQIIVSRKDATNKIKLSPMNNSRGKNSEHSKKVGQFDRSAFKTSSERIFDQQFGFERQLTETFRYANNQKNGKLQERIILHKEKIKHERSAKHKQAQKQKNVPSKKQTWLKEKPQTNSLLRSLLKTEWDDSSHVSFVKRKKKKRDQGLYL